MANKKIIIASSLLLLFLGFFFAQTVEKFSQKIEWTKDSYATKYEILVQVLSSGKYVDYYKTETQKNSLNVSFPSGTYRYRIYQFDLLGRKTEPSKWFPLTIEKTVQPVLKTSEQKTYYFKKDKPVEITVYGSGFMDKSIWTIINSKGTELPCSAVIIKGKSAVLSIQAKNVSEGKFRVKVRNPADLVATGADFSLAKEAETVVVPVTTPDPKLSETVKNQEKLLSEKDQNIKTLSDQLQKEKERNEKLAEAKAQSEKNLTDQLQNAKEENEKLAADKAQNDKLELDDKSQNQEALSKELQNEREKNEELSKALLEEKDRSEKLENRLKTSEKNLEDAKAAAEKADYAKAEAEKKLEETKASEEVNVRKEKEVVVKEVVVEEKIVTRTDLSEIKVCVGPAFFIDVYNDDLISHSSNKTPLGVNAQLSFIPMKNQLGFFGVNFDIKHFWWNESTDNYSVGTTDSQIHLLFDYERSFFKDHLRFGFEAGPGMNIISAETSYKGTMLGDSSKSTNSVYLSALVEFSIYYVPVKNFMIKLQADFSHIFATDMPTGIFTPAVCLGLRL